MPKKILVVDDNRLIRSFIAKLFEGRGCDVRQADSGISALSVLDDFTPHVIFLDIFMPHVNGERLCRIIRGADRLKGCRIVIISAALTEMDEALDRIGADAFIPKEAFAKMTPRLLAAADSSAAVRADGAEAGRVTRPTDEEIQSRQITRELLALNRHLEALLANMSEGVIEVFEGRVVYVNHTTTELLERPEERLLGHRLVDIFPPSCRGTIQTLPAGGDTGGSPPRLTLRIGSRHIQMTRHRNRSDLSGEMFILKDVTEKNLILEQLIASERWASAGLLSQTLAAEINSPAQGILSTLSHLKRTHGKDTALLKDLDAIRTALESIRQTGSSLQAINRTEAGGVQDIDINELVQSTVAINRSLLRKNRCRIRTCLAPHLPAVRVLPQRIEQVLLHIVGNAVEAVVADEREAGAGEIGVDTRMVEGNIVIEIWDTGPGLPDALGQRIFDLFVSSRTPAGRGVGLTVCHRIVKEHGGTLTAANRPQDKGAVFTISLPAAPPGTRQPLHPAENRQ